ELKKSRVAPTIAVVVVALVGFVIWLAVSSGGNSNQATPSGGDNSAATMTADELKATGAGANAPIYWVGTKPRSTYELTHTTDGKYLVRYLPEGSKAGTQGLFLTIGTYPVQNAYAIGKAAAKDPSAVQVPVGNNGVAFYGRSRPTSV